LSRQAVERLRELEESGAAVRMDQEEAEALAQRRSRCC